MKFNYENIHGKIWWWQGFEHVTNMEGGYSAWVDSGFAGDKPAEELKTFCKFRPWSECFPLRDNSPCGLSCYWLYVKMKCLFFSSFIMKMKCICILADAITSFYVVHEIPFSILHIVSYLFVPRNMASKFTYLLYWLTVLVVYLSNIFTFSSYSLARIALQLLLF
jgi:hypothetical protein